MEPALTFEDLVKKSPEELARMVLAYDAALKRSDRALCEFAVKMLTRIEGEFIQATSVAEHIQREPK